MVKMQSSGWQLCAHGLVIGAAWLAGCDGEGHGGERGAAPDQRAFQLRADGDEACGGGALRCRRIARNSESLLIGAVRPALNDGGLVAFAAHAGGAPGVLLGRWRGLTTLDVGSFELELPVRVALDDAGRVAFLAPALDETDGFGAFAVARRGRRLTVHYAPEPGGGLADGGAITARDALALAPNGILAFSSIAQQGGAPDSGAVYRGTVRGGVARVVSASDVSRPNQFGFSNVGALDVNVAGTIAAQMQHVTRCGLQSGVLVFDAPEPTLAEARHAITGLALELAPAVAIDEEGRVAFALPGTEPSVMVLRCPPAGSFEKSFLATGVYTAQPSVFTVAPQLSPVADNGGAFASFGAVDTAAGLTVFEATLDVGGGGIFRGADPEADAIVRVGDELGGELVSEVQLGQLNAAGELALLVTSATGRSVWRVSGVVARAPGAAEP